jgi:hypothetical protein
MQLVQQLKQQARDGTLSEVLQQPVVGWHVKTEASSAHRERREVPVTKLIIPLTKLHIFLKYFT